MGATFAYFSVSNTNTASTTVTSTTPNVGIVTLTEATNNLKLNPTAAQMEKKSVDTSYWATAEGEVGTSQENITFATFSTNKGEKMQYSCTAKLTVTVDGGMAEKLQNGDVMVKLTAGNGITFGDGSKFTSGTPISVHSLIDMPEETLNIKLDDNTKSAELTGEVYLVNKVNDPQDDLAGQTLNFSVTVSDLDCHASEMAGE